MKRSTCNGIASAAVALCPVSFGVRLYLFYSYFSSRPRSPNSELGFVRPLNNHGSYVYLTDVESTGLALLLVAFFAGFLLTLVVVPKDFVLPPPGTPKWITHLGASFRHDLSHPSRRLVTIFLCSAALYLGAITLAGNSMASFVVSHGFVLD